MKDLILTSGVIGAILPIAIAVINQVRWSTAVKSEVAFVICLIAAGVTCWVKGDLNATDYLASALAVFTLARTTYAGVWKPTGVATAVEEKTSKTPA